VSTRPRVVLVDDHRMFRTGVRAELGDAVEVVGEADDVDSAVAAVTSTAPDVVLLDVHLPGGGGQDVVAAIAPGHPDVRFLALSAARPELGTGVITVGRGRGHQPPQVARLSPLAGTPGEVRRRALEELAVVVDLYDAGLRSPLPLFCDTSAAWAEARHRGGSEDDAYKAARGEWNDDRFPGERSNAEHRYVWDNDPPLAAIMQEPIGAGEGGPGWPDAEPHRFGALACRLWYPLLEHEHLSAAP